MDPQNFRVLIVDDDPTIRSLLAEALSEEGFSSATAANGIDALDNIKAARPNLVLLDIQMPKMDGPTFLQALAKTHIKVPVIVMSAAVSPRTAARELHADGYLAKPFDLDQVLEQVEDVFAQYSDTKWSDPKRPVATNRIHNRERKGALAPHYRA